MWRPTKASKNANGSYTIASYEIMPIDEEWEFIPGQKVRCKQHTFSCGTSGLIAYEHD